MKNKFSLLLVLFVLSASIATSCKKDKKDDPTPTTKNAFQYDSKEYELTKGFKEDLGVNSGLTSYDVDITLTSSSINYNSVAEEFNGKGDIIYLDLNTSVEGELVDGTYNFSSARNACTFVEGVVGIDYDIENETGTLDDIIGGSVVIKTIDGDQQLEFELTLSGNRKVTGFYNGNIQNIN